MHSGVIGNDKGTGERNGNSRCAARSPLYHQHSHLIPHIPTKSGHITELGGALLRCVLKRLEKERKKKSECILGKRGIGYIEITILNKAIQKTEMLSTPWCLLRILPLQSLWSLCSYSKVMVQQVKKKETGLETVTTKMSTASLLLSAIQNACHPLTTTHPLGPWRSAFSKAHFSCHWTFYQEWVCGIVSEQS